MWCGNRQSFVILNSSFIAFGPKQFDISILEIKARISVSQKSVAAISTLPFALKRQFY